MKKYYILVLYSFFYLQAQSQVEFKKNKEFDKYAYVDVIKTYQRLFERGIKSPKTLLKLANAYYYSGNLANAAKYYTALFAITSDVSPECYYRYAQSLKAIKAYAEADKMLLKFNQENGNDSRAKLALNQKDYLEIIKQNSGRYTIKNAEINSKFSDYGSAYYNGNLVFASSRRIGNSLKSVDPSTGEGFTNLYVAKINSEGELLQVERLSRDLNSKFHESTPAFTKDGKTVYFTRNNYSKGKRGMDLERTTLLKIYKANFVDGAWENIVELPFNSDNYSVAHPCLSTDETTLYFASNMPGTHGQSDLFKVRINENGTYGTPENLGRDINTEGRETFPFITEKNELYFASDGHPGLGGMDVFVSKAKPNGNYSEVINVGEPINSPRDDFGFLIDTKNKTGFVTSNREGGRGGDDIYQIREKMDLKYPCKQFLSGVVIDNQTSQVVSDTKVILYDSNYKLVQIAQSNSRGEFDLGQVDCGAKYYIRGEKENYDVEEVTAEIALNSGNTSISISLDTSVKQLAVGDDVAKGFGLKTIYFDLYQYNIRPDAALELAKVYEVMIQNPKIKIEIRSHTDCRQDDMSNIILSQRRADATKDWLVANGIAKERLSTRGFGETQLLNNCTDDVLCSEEQHQANRRSEFIIVSID